MRRSVAARGKHVISRRVSTSHLVGAGGTMCVTKDSSISSCVRPLSDLPGSGCYMTWRPFPAVSVRPSDEPGAHAAMVGQGRLGPVRSTTRPYGFAAVRIASASNRRLDDQRASLVMNSLNW